jgi:lipoprotein NlpD
MNVANDGVDDGVTPSAEQAMKQTKSESRRRPLALAGLLASALLLGACAGGPNRAPVEDRKPAVRPGGPGPVAAVPPAASAAAPADASRPLPGAENAGKPGYYAVRPGDTLIRIALENGQNWRDVQRWNNLGDPNLIEVGQVLRVAPPGLDPAPANANTAGGVAVTRPVQPAGRVDSRPLDARPASAPAAASATPAVPPVTATPAVPPVAATPAAPAIPAAAPAIPAVASAAPPAPAAKPPAREGDDDLPWMWPATGPVVTGFDEARSKGVAISGKAGDPVLAAADGRVVYAGSGLRGYGNLVIVKHNATYLTAYAHNQALLVKDEQVVRRGQKIAEMGSSDAERVQLHFEIRRLGVPIDPLRLLPAR